ncbi:MAG TPA: hypothetical protein VNO70_11080 [Blastocatellia bacterium]|nr:hypothetical protein [Blastocatellia bacterium]
MKTLHSLLAPEFNKYKYAHKCHPVLEASVVPVGEKNMLWQDESHLRVREVKVGAFTPPLPNPNQAQALDIARSAAH